MSQQKKREFKLLSPGGGHVRGTYTGSCPHQAALKAASKGHHSILLREHHGLSQYGDKIHVFAGSQRSLKPSEQTPFALKHGIKTKSAVKKIGCM